MSIYSKWPHSEEPVFYLHFTKDEVQNQKDGVVFLGLVVGDRGVGKPPFLSPFFKDGKPCSAVSKQHPQRKSISFIGITWTGCTVEKIATFLVRGHLVVYSQADTWHYPTPTKVPTKYHHPKLNDLPVSFSMLFFSFPALKILDSTLSLASFFFSFNI